VSFRDRRPWTGLANKAIAVVAFVITAGLASAPVLYHTIGSGSNVFHVMLLGYTEPSASVVHR
jgi:hypothetical protein